VHGDPPGDGAGPCITGTGRAHAGGREREDRWLTSGICWSGSGSGSRCRPMRTIGSFEDGPGAIVEAGSPPQWWRHSWSSAGWGVRQLEGPPALGQLVKSEDGGASWTQVGLEVNSVCFTDQTNGWAVGPAEAGLALFKSTDGGTSWDEHAIPNPGGDMAAGW